MEKYDPLAINYKMDTLEDILSIPVPTEKFELPDDFMDSIEYVLQRKATEFKKEGDMECAIACLEKAVEIIPFSPMLYPDCFERLEKYLKLNNQWDEAEEVSLEGAKQEKNFQNEFKNKVLSDAAKLGTDLLEASYHEPASAKEAMYRGRVFSISGSDFVEMFVGVGASRVRDLFEEGKRHAPCIIFIDEIDAVARQRGTGMGGGHDEREQTLNQLLVEMDGFGVNEGIIVMAATNRVDILDPAILRPGRFDRKVAVGRPDVKGREEILRVHAKDKPLGEDVDLAQIARTTAGFTGADLENLLNEAAIEAARKGRGFILQSDIKGAFIKVGIGAEKKSRVISDKEKKITAFHEAGHAILFHVLPDVGPVYSVSIIPTGVGAAGYTMPLPEKDEMFNTKGKMLQDITVSLGGRVAEELIFDDITTGASQDIKQATAYAKSMVTKFGMSEALGLVSYGDDNDEVFIGRDFGHTSRGYGEQVATTIDSEVKRIIDECYDRAKTIIKEHEAVLYKCADLLLEKEKITREEFEALFEE